MSGESKVKNAAAAVIFSGALLYMFSTIFEWNLGEKLNVVMSSLWGDSPQTNSVSTSNQFLEDDLEPTPKKSSNKKKVNAIEAIPEEPINLNAEKSQDRLDEELMEDSLWEQGILSGRPEGVRSGKAVLEALAEIDNWSPVEGGFSPSRLQMYLRYPKLWVRLSAFAFAIKAKFLDEAQEVKIARLIAIKTQENPFQVQRFLQRYVEKDYELFQLLKARLFETKPPSEEPSVPEVNEDTDNAS